MMSTATTATSARGPSQNKPSSPPTRKQEWSPRMWEGCNFFAWMRLLLRNRLAVHWSCWYIAAIVTMVSFCHSVLSLVQQLVYGRRIRKTIIQHPPIFILGHWRTGTTLLHEMMILDERHGYPTTYECMDPNHFLLTEKLFTRWLKFLVPSRRPMDNMRAGFDRPQEDEFALCMLGQDSPYLTIAFPNHPPQGLDYLGMEGVSPRKVAAWKRVFLRFLQQITYRNPRRLVLKSPPHTARVRLLKEMFPDALFVHIVRNPYVVFPSTVHLWKTLYRTHGLQKPTNQGIEELVLSTFVRLYDKLEEGKKLLRREQFYEVRYEDLVRDPVREMQNLYEHLQLGGFDRYVPRLREFLAGIKDYETNRYEMTPVQRDEVTRRWGAVIRRYGYEDIAPLPSPSPRRDESPALEPVQGPTLEASRLS